MAVIGISSTAQYSQSTTSISLHRNSGKNVFMILSKCLRPYYVVRLSGPALLGMEKMHHFHPNRSKILEMTYTEQQIQFLNTTNKDPRNGTLTEITLQPVAVSGTYDLEIVQLVCDVDIKMIDQHCVPNSTETMMLNRPQQLYLERHDNQADIASPGYWGRLNNTVDSPVVRTRYQLDKHCSTGNCDLSWYQDYSFVGQDDKHLAVFENRTFCLLGDSHSRRMTISFQAILAQQYQVTGKKNRAVHIPMTYPIGFQSAGSKLFSGLQRCTDVVVAIGQWPLSQQKKSKGHYDPDKWIQEISTIVDYLHSNTTASIILRAIHYIPLGYVRTSCPPKDWRMPYFVDVYNEKLRSLYKAHPAFRESENIFVDTNAVLGPVWDTAEDFNHNSDKAGIPEAIYILNELMMSGEKEEPSQLNLDSTSGSAVFVSSSAANSTNTNIPMFTRSDGISHLISQQILLVIFVWFIAACFFPLLQRTRRMGIKQ